MFPDVNSMPELAGVGAAAEVVTCWIAGVG